MTCRLRRARLQGTESVNLRRLRLLFEDFPKNHNLVLIGRTSLLADLDLGVNQDIKSRVTYSAITERLGPDAMKEFLLRELDQAGLGHNTSRRPPSIFWSVPPTAFCARPAISASAALSKSSDRRSGPSISTSSTGI